SKKEGEKRTEERGIFQRAEGRGIHDVTPSSPKPVSESGSRSRYQRCPPNQHSRQKKKDNQDSLQLALK
ncbi:7390_t:CDS:2, partial [Dentiscutata heterogama]